MVLTVVLQLHRTNDFRQFLKVHRLADVRVKVRAGMPRLRAGLYAACFPPAFVSGRCFAAKRRSFFADTRRRAFLRR